MGEVEATTGKRCLNVYFLSLRLLLWALGQRNTYLWRALPSNTSTGGASFRRCGLAGGRSLYAIMIGGITLQRRLDIAIFDELLLYLGSFTSVGYG